MKRLLIQALLLMPFASLPAQDESLEHVNFPLNSHVVVDAFQGLNLLAEVMVKHADLELEVVGFTDDIASVPYNKNLSVRRANNVKAYLVSRGAKDEKITVDGRGKTEFVAENVSREGRFQNRRVELFLYETVDGNRKLVGYHRLLELFFGSTPTAQAKNDHDNIMAKLSDLEAAHADLKKTLEEKLAQVPTQGAAAVTTSEEGKKSWGSSSVRTELSFGGFSGVSVDLGIDENDDFTGRVKGQYFKAVTDRFAVQGQGEFTHYDSLNESQFDSALIYQTGHFKAAGFASYKFVEMEGYSSAGIGQAGVLFDFVFDKGHVGLFGTAPFSDGDVIASHYLNISYLHETYLEVVKQAGLSFGFNIGAKAGISGSLAKLDTDTSSDLGGNLRFEWNFSDHMTLYFDFERNENLLSDDDSDRYALGMRWGTWAQARYMAADQVSPIDIPKIRYEIHTRVQRVGNTAPLVEAGANQMDVPAGIVTLHGSATDAENDALRFAWTQLSGPAVVIHDEDKATATFEGEAGQAYSFLLTVRDEKGGVGSDVVSIFMEAVVIPPPVVRFFNAIPDTIDEGDFSTLVWSTEHADSVTIEGLGQVNAEGSLVIRPDSSTAYTMTATNANGTVRETVTVTVVPEVVVTPNTPPVAHAGADQVNYFEGTIMLDGSASYDVDGDALSYRWVQISGVDAQLSGADTPQPSFAAVRNRAYVFRLIVTDGRGGIATDDVVVQIF